MPSEILLLASALVVRFAGLLDLDPAWLGDSVGHWEGDTLVVDVTGFKE